jgi:hypothetical protein
LGATQVLALAPEVLEKPNRSTKSASTWARHARTFWRSETSIVLSFGTADSDFTAAA